MAKAKSQALAKEAEAARVAAQQAALINSSEQAAARAQQVSMAMEQAPFGLALG